MGLAQDLVLVLEIEREDSISLRRMKAAQQLRDGGLGLRPVEQQEPMRRTPHHPRQQLEDVLAHAPARQGERKQVDADAQRRRRLGSHPRLAANRAEGDRALIRPRAGRIGSNPIPAAIVPDKANRQRTLRPGGSGERGNPLTPLCGGPYNPLQIRGAGTEPYDATKRRRPFLSPENRDGEPSARGEVRMTTVLHRPAGTPVAYATRLALIVVVGSWRRPGRPTPTSRQPPAGITVQFPAALTADMAVRLREAVYAPLKRYQTYYQRHGQPTSGFKLLCDFNPDGRADATGDFGACSDLGRRAARAAGQET